MLMQIKLPTYLPKIILIIKNTYVSSILAESINTINQQTAEIAIVNKIPKNLRIGDAFIVTVIIDKITLIT